MKSIRASLFAYAASRVDEIIEGIDSDGKVWFDGTWGIMNQDVILPLAALAMIEHPGNPCFGRSDLVEAVHKVAQGTFALQDNLGMVEFVKPDGSKWGMIHMPWLFYGMLETYGLLALDVPDLRRQYWKGRLALVYNHVRDALRPGHGVHNIPTWHGMALTLGGKLLGRPDWHQLGQQVVRRAAGAQTEGGWWPEGTGPTTLYNLTYTHALGVYQQVSGDVAVLPALQRAGRFHRLMQYPDSTLASVVDGRVRYHHQRHAIGLPGLALTEDGQGYLGVWQQSELPLRCEGNGWTMLGSCLVRLTDAVYEAAPVDGRLADDQAEIAHDGPWTVVASAFTGQADPANRWVMDRAQHLEVHHTAAGLVIGGGNAKRDPALVQARFKVGNEDGQHHAGSAELIQDDDALVAVRTSYETGEVLWHVRRDGEGLRVEATASGEGDCTASLQLWAEPGQRLSFDDETVTLDAAPVARPAQAFTLGSVRFESDSEGIFAWPLWAFNPYTEDGTAPLEDAVATFSFGVPVGGSTTIHLTTP